MEIIEKGNKIILKQDAYPIPIVKEVLKYEGFRYSNKYGGFVGKVTKKNYGFLELLGYKGDLKNKKNKESRRCQN